MGAAMGAGSACSGGNEYNGEHKCSGDVESGAEVRMNDDHAAPTASKKRKHRGKNINSKIRARAQKRAAVHMVDE